MSRQTVGIPLREVLKLAPLSQAVVLGGHAGLDRIVSTVNVMETDDSFLLLNGNELLITAFYAVRDDLQAQLRWIDELAKRGCAGLIICYIGRYFKGNTLDQLVQRAEELAFPLLTIPEEATDKRVVYSDIITSVLAELLQLQTRKLEFALSVHERLTHEVLMGASLQTLIESLSELLRSTVLMVDERLNIIAASPYHLAGRTLLNQIVADAGWKRPYRQAASTQDITCLMDALQESRRDWEQTLGCAIEISSRPVQVERTLTGHLVVFNCGEVIPEIQDYVLQVGVTAIALERMRAISIRETERRLQGDFLDDLLSRSSLSPEIIKRQALALGINIEDKCAVMVIGLSDPSGSAPTDGAGQRMDHTRELVFRVIEDIVHRESRRNMVVPRGSRILILLATEGPLSSANAAKEKSIALAETILREVRNHLNSGGAATQSLDLSIGVSGPEHNYITLHRGYADAVRALEIGQRLLGPGHVVHISDTYLYSLLDSVAERRESRQIVEDVLGPVKAYDRANGTDLLKTLELLCLSGEDNVGVARKLYIHRNTLNYRQMRIREMLGFDPFSGPGRLKAQFALMLNKLLEAPAK